MWLKGINSDNLLEADPQVCTSNTESEEGGFLLWPGNWTMCVSLPHSVIMKKLGKVTVLHILANHTRAAKHSRKNQ